MGGGGSSAPAVEGSKRYLPPIAPANEVLHCDLSSKINLCVRCTELRKPVLVYVVVYSKWLHEQHFEQIGMTEVVDTPTTSPSFNKSFSVLFRMELQRLLRFEVYRLNDLACIEDLRAQSYIGCIETMLVDVMMARSKKNSDGWLHRPIKSPRPTVVKNGSVSVFAEEESGSKQALSFEIKAVGVRSQDMWKLKPDPYIVLNRTTLNSEDGTSLITTPIFRSDVARHTTKPKWERGRFTTPELCASNFNQEIVVEMFDWYRVQPDRVVGECVTSYSALEVAFRQGKSVVLPVRKALGPRLRGKSARNKSFGAGSQPIANKDEDEVGAKKKPKGSTRYGSTQCYIHFESLGVQRYYSFLDYVRGGLQIKLLIGFDFSRPPDAGMHSLFQGPTESVYLTAFRSISEIMRSFDDDDSYPVYGFGAMLPPSYSHCSDCFALSGDFFDPEITGLERIELAYRRAQKVVRPHGPTNLKPIIELTANMCKPYAEATSKGENGIEMQYYLLLLLTDGEVNDQQATIDALVEASPYPMSVVIIGMGGKSGRNLDFLREVSADVHAFRRYKGYVDAREHGAMRKVVHYVEYDDFEGRPEELAAATLSRLPHEVVGYYEAKDVLPRGLGQFEDESGQPIDAKTQLKQSQADKAKNDRKKTTSRNASRKGTKQGPQGTSRKGTNTGTIGGDEDDSEPEETEMEKFRRIKEEELIQQINALPPFLREERERLLSAAKEFGYEPGTVKRAVGEGIPSPNMELLLDIMMHGGYGKLPCYKKAAEDSIPDEAVNAIEAQTYITAGPQTASTLAIVKPPVDRRFSLLEGSSRSNSRFATKDGPSPNQSQLLNAVTDQWYNGRSATPGGPSKETYAVPEDNVYYAFSRPGSAPEESDLMILQNSVGYSAGSSESLGSTLRFPEDGNSRRPSPEASDRLRLTSGSSDSRQTTASHNRLPSPEAIMGGRSSSQTTVGTASHDRLQTSGASVGLRGASHAGWDDRPLARSHSPLSRSHSPSPLELPGCLPSPKNVRPRSG